jgi:glycosyltransferase involved in cell wall biosynthesis
VRRTLEDNHRRDVSKRRAGEGHPGGRSSADRSLCFLLSAQPAFLTPQNNMKVLHFVTASSNNPLLLDFVGELRSSGIQQVVGTLQPRGDLHNRVEGLGIETISLNAPRRRDYLGAVVELVRFVRRRQIGVVHTHTIDASLVSLLAATLGRIPARVVTRHHTDERLLYSGSWRGRLTDRLIGKYLSDAVVALAPGNARVISELDRIPPSHISVVPNGYDWSRVRSSEAGAGRVREELGLADSFVCLVAARMTWVKGHDVLLKAMAKAGIPKTMKMIFAGTGPEEKKLKEAVGAYGFADQCLFVGFRTDLFDIMAAANIIVHPSRHEAQCQVLIEAMALGRPVIATNVGAAEEIVIPGETGWLVPSDDPEALGRALTEAAISPARTLQYGLRGRELVRRKYPIANMANGYLRVYRRLLATGSQALR